MKLNLDGGGDWQLAGGKWEEDQEGIRVGRGEDGEGLQGYGLAFYKPKAYADLEAEFRVQMPTNHADLGLIVRAQDPTHYYLIHFPQCGQGYRAQHFWAALSVADGSGYLRVLALEHVQRVPSNPLGIANHARVRVEGNRFQVWVNGHPALDVCDDRYRQGRIGLAGFVQARHGQVQVEGREVAALPWDESVGQVKNWMVPFGAGAGAVGGGALPDPLSGPDPAHHPRRGHELGPHLYRHLDLGHGGSVRGGARQDPFCLRGFLAGAAADAVRAGHAGRADACPGGPGLLSSSEKGRRAAGALAPHCRGRGQPVHCLPGPPDCRPR